MLSSTGLVARLYVTLPHISLAHPTRIWPFELPHKRQHASWVFAPVRSVHSRMRSPGWDGVLGIHWGGRCQRAGYRQQDGGSNQACAHFTVLIDDGWSNTDRTKETLIDFGADRQRFPRACPHHAAQNALWRAQRRRGRRSKAIGMVWTNRVAAASCRHQ